MAWREWDETSEQAADIQVICTHCYDAARARNTEPPPLVRGARAQLTEDEAAALIHHATHEMQALQDLSSQRLGWLEMAHWRLAGDARTLTFTDPDRPTVIADTRLVGSYSTTTSTFQWAWETVDDPSEVRDVARLRTFGEVRGLSRLTTANWEAELVDGWEMTSIAGYLLGTEAVYRAPMDHLYWFMLLSNLRHPS